MTTENNNWLDELVANLETEILKVTKFKTHKIRKTFLNKVTSIINDAVQKNTLSRPKGISESITRPMSNHTPVGHVVMTEGMSNRGDEMRKTARTW